MFYRELTRRERRELRKKGFRKYYKKYTETEGPMKEVYYEAALLCLDSLLDELSYEIMDAKIEVVNWRKRING